MYILPRIPRLLFLGLASPVGIELGIGPNDLSALRLSKEEVERD
jgi:hypothetical protein